MVQENMLFKDLMFDVDERSDESDSLGEDPIAPNEPYEDY
jgi:hypothetical protein